MWPTHPCSGSLMAWCQVDAWALVAVPHACAFPFVAACSPVHHVLGASGLLIHLLAGGGASCIFLVDVGCNTSSFVSEAFSSPAWWLDAGSWLGQGWC